jgi:predicted alpha/beta superfamily hydrolase
LSPWACGPIVYKNDHFDGGADSFVEFIKTSILTFCYQNIAAKSDYLIIAGYSLAGLFSIYSAFKISTFDAIVSASGSLWFPKFMEYVKSNVFIKKPTFIYLSIGDKESNTKNEYLKTTVSNTQELQIYFNNLGIKSIFELNPGNHFQDANFRLAKGIGIALNFYSSKK